MDRWVDKWGRGGEPTDSQAVNRWPDGQTVGRWVDSDWTDTDGRVGGQMGRWMGGQTGEWVAGGKDE